MPMSLKVPMMPSIASGSTMFSGRWSLISAYVRKPRSLPNLIRVFSFWRRRSSSSSVASVSDEKASFSSAFSLALRSLALALSTAFSSARSTALSAATSSFSGWNSLGLRPRRPGTLTDGNTYPEVSMAASVAASVVWLTAGGLLATRVSDLSAVLADFAVTLLGFAAAWDSGFLIGTGAFDYTTTCLFRIKFLAALAGLRPRTCRLHKSDNTTTYLHLVGPTGLNRTPPAHGGNSTASDTCVGARNHD